MDNRARLYWVIALAVAVLGVAVAAGFGLFYIG